MRVRSFNIRILDPFWNRHDTEIDRCPETLRLENAPNKPVDARPRRCSVTGLLESIQTYLHPPQGPKVHGLTRIQGHEVEQHGVLGGVPETKTSWDALICK